MAGIYIHIPFCKQACHYCDFHFSTNTRLQGPMLQAIAKELYIRRTYMGGAQVKSIYLGGGTPSLLTPNALETLLTQIDQHFSLNSIMEVTLEANPDDITLAQLQSLRALGINRLSIGIQSFEDSVLRYLNRAHDSKKAIASVEIARKAGFENLSIDLMYAIPGTRKETWKTNLATALQLQPEHIAAYCLTIEKNTVFGRWKERGQLKAVHEEVAARQFEVLVAELTKYHYEHYEVSNFSKPGYYARHNTNYWKQGQYLGVGPSAHSYNGKTRQYNVAHNQRYIDSLKNGEIPCTVEVLTEKDHINEYVMTRLRTQWGCDMAWLKRRYGYVLAHNTYLKQLVDQQLVVKNGSKLLLTTKGKLLADQIAADLFVD
ncbi:MAG: radical SAM family heme chaperone HemW [Bacteroidota bacterium]